MIRHSSFRLLALVAGIAVISSCDGGSATGVPEFGGLPGGGGISTGGGGTTTTGGDGVAPVVAIDTPSTRGQLVNLGDSLLVAVRVRDNQTGIASVVIEGLSYRGDRDLGTQTVTTRYTQVRIPGTAGTLPQRTAVSRDTVIRRFLFPKAPMDTLQDSLVIRAIAIDHSGLADTATQVVRVVSGPRVTIVTPAAGDSVLPGTRLNVTFRATHSQGVSSIRVRVRGDSTTINPRLDTTFVRSYSGSSGEVSDTASVVVPSTAPGRSRITITAEATDVNRIPGAATPVQIFVRGTAADAPRVTQSVPSRAEINDTITINATGDGFRAIGFIVRDSAGNVLRRDSVAFSGAQQDLSPRQVRMSLRLPAEVQGRRVTIVSFATDRNGRVGYSVAATATRAETSLAAAYADSAQIVFGLTYSLPRAGVAGDLAVDPVRGNVFVSNTAHNRVELWRNAGRAFDAEGVRVGAEPWGMTITAGSPDTLLVANSGGTNISRVYIAPANVSGMTESRLLTRNTIAYTVQEARDDETGKIRIVLTGPISWSDRPQYIAQSAAGRIYYSTKPTPAAPAGTLRYLDATQAVPDSRQIWQYGRPSTTGTYTIFNIDAASVVAAPAADTLSDLLILCDHPTGTAEETRCGESRGGFLAAIAALKVAVPNSDVDMAAVDPVSLSLTDTTYAAWSGNRQWIAFGEGQATPGRVMMVNDQPGYTYEQIFFSAGVDVRDLIDNASDRVFGLAIDQQGKMLGVHGTRSYFSAVERPFHLRKQGRFDSFAEGAGIAYHPQADINPSNPGNAATRLAFVASANGTIDIVDAYYYVSRGRISIRNKLYGPLRASMPLPGDPANVVVKLYGLTDRGLVVIDVTAQDIKPLQ